MLIKKRYVVPSHYMVIALPASEMRRWMGVVASLWRLVFCRHPLLAGAFRFGKAVDVSGRFGGSGVCLLARNLAAGAMAAFFLATVSWTVHAAGHWLGFYMVMCNTTTHEQ